MAVFGVILPLSLSLSSFAMINRSGINAGKASSKPRKPQQIYYEYIDNVRRQRINYHILISPHPFII